MSYLQCNTLTSSFSMTFRNVLLISHELAVDLHFASDILLKAMKIVRQLWTPTSDSSVEED